MLSSCNILYLTIWTVRTRCSSEFDKIKHYQYRAAAFTGVRNYDDVATGGTRVCAVLSCTGDTIGTCGRRFSKYEANTTAEFEELSIVATVPTPRIVPDLEAHDSSFFPVTLTTSIMPLESKDYDYEIIENGNTTDLRMTLRNRDTELYSFAVWGRVFERDGQDPTPPLSGSAHRIVYNSILVIAMFVSNSL